MPYHKKLDEREVLVGDNLSSHLSLNVIKLCEENNIAFMFLPANSIHICQPLDVAFFRPLKSAKRFIMDKWKRREGIRLSTIPKEAFPRLLSE